VETALVASERRGRGLGNDKQLRVQPILDDKSGYVWIQRWDSPAEADEFAAAARDHLANRRAETDDYRFRFVRIDDDRTVLLAGNEALLESVAFETPSNETVRVSLAG